MAARVKHRFKMPKGGYRFKDGDNVFTGQTLGEIYRKVRDYRAANKTLLSTKDQLQDEIEGQICAENPQWCVNEDGTPTILQMAGNFATAMARWAANGFGLVDRVEFERRRDICLGCPHWRSWHDGGIGYCNTCGCPTGRVSIKLWLPTEKCPDKPPRW